MRLRTARDYQDPRAPVRRLADRSRRKLAGLLVVALKPAGPDLKEASRLISLGRWREVWGLINWDHFRETMRVPLGFLGEVVLDGGDLGAERITTAFRIKGKRVVTRKAATVSGDRPADLGLAAGLLSRGDAPRIAQKAFLDDFNFDRFNEATTARIRAYQDALIAELGADARHAIEQAILDGLRAGKTPDEVAAGIRRSIGLTARQAQAVLNYERLLRELNPEALARGLVSPEDADVIRSAIDAGRVDEATVRRLVDNYESAYLDYRAMTIATTEATRAASMGLQESYAQAVERGVMPAEAVTRHWQVALDERTCAVCLSIPTQNPDGVGLEEPFVASGREFMAPPVHVNCRCSLEFVTNLDLVPDEGN